MEAVREKWTDERLDDLNLRVERGFESVDRRFDAIERRFEAIERRLDRMLFGLCSMYIAGFVGLASLIVSRG